MPHRTKSELDSRDRAILRVLWLTLVLNWGVALGKIAVGIMAARIAVLADGLHSLLDGANNVLAIVAIRLAARPPDEDHPYGHRKFENIAAMMIGGLIVLICWEVLDNVLRTLWGHFRHGRGLMEPRPFEWIFAIIVGASLLVNLGVSWYERREGERLASPLLKADAAHTASDAAVTCLSLGSIFLGTIAWWIDPLLALAVLFFLIHAAWSVIRENLPAFTDRSRLDPEEIRRLVEDLPGVDCAHAIRSHGSERDIHIDLHIVVAETLTAREVEDIERNVGDALRGAFPNVTAIGIQHETDGADPPDPLWKV